MNRNRENNKGEQIGRRGELKDIRKTFKNTNYMCIFILTVLSIYYIYRMFYITPWYDETYTYINFINEGFFYSATHWPAPNNHILFSMLSALVNWGGIYIGLRGISLLAAIGTAILLYMLFKEVSSGTVSIITVLSYSMLLLTNKLAVQGRGYSLATFFLMLAVYCGYRICFKLPKKAEYIWWAVALWAGLYTVVTSVYWVVALCLCGGIVLLILKKYKNLIRLIISSFVAAIATLISYTVMWLSIGAQQISIDVTTGYYGANVWFLIKEFPRTCLMRGIEFMTSDRSVQGVDRNAFLGDFKYLGRDILAAFFGKTNILYFYCLLFVIAICFVLFVVCAVKKKTKYIYFLALSSIGFVGIFVTLWIQSAYPFVRVFSFLGIFIIMPIVLVFSVVAEFLKKYVKWKYAWIVVCVAATLFTGIKLTNPVYMLEYDYLDYYALDAIKNTEWDGIGTYLVSDYYMEQQIQYHKIIGDDLELQADSDSPDVILTKKQLSGYWPEMITNIELENCCVQERPVIYENDVYIVYGK